MYFITCFEKCEADCLGDIRTFGYYEDFETCKLALNGNRCDMHEGLYYFAVVEKIHPGIHPRAKEIAWFKWDDKLQGFFETNKPDCTHDFCNHALG